MKKIIHEAYRQNIEINRRDYMSDDQTAGCSRPNTDLRAQNGCGGSAYYGNEDRYSDLSNMDKDALENSACVVLARDDLGPMTPHVSMSSQQRNRQRDVDNPPHWQHSNGGQVQDAVFLHSVEDDANDQPPMSIDLSMSAPSSKNSDDGNEQPPLPIDLSMSAPSSRNPGDPGSLCQPTNSTLTWTNDDFRPPTGPAIGQNQQQQHRQHQPQQQQQQQQEQHHQQYQQQQQHQQHHRRQQQQHGRFTDLCARNYGLNVFNSDQPNISDLTSGRHQNPDAFFGSTLDNRTLNGIDQQRPSLIRMHEIDQRNASNINRMHKLDQRIDLNPQLPEINQITAPYTRWHIPDQQNRSHTSVQIHGREHRDVPLEYPLVPQFLPAQKTGCVAGKEPYRDTHGSDLLYNTPSSFRSNQHTEHCMHALSQGRITSNASTSFPYVDPPHPSLSRRYIHGGNPVNQFCPIERNDSYAFESDVTRRCMCSRTPTRFGRRYCPYTVPSDNHEKMYHRNNMLQVDDTSSRRIPCSHFRGNGALSQDRCSAYCSSNIGNNQSMSVHWHQHPRRCCRNDNHMVRPNDLLNPVNEEGLDAAIDLRKTSSCKQTWTGEDQTTSLEALTIMTKDEKDTLYTEFKQKWLGKIHDVMGTELQCSICQEIIIKATSLGCSHNVCSLCLKQWIKVKIARPDCGACRRALTCPHCRSKVKQSSRCLNLDNFIDAMFAEMSDLQKEERRKFKEERKEAEEQFDAENEHIDLFDLNRDDEDDDYHFHNHYEGTSDDEDDFANPASVSIDENESDENETDDEIDSDSWNFEPDSDNDNDGNGEPIDNEVPIGGGNGVISELGDGINDGVPNNEVNGDMNENGDGINENEASDGGNGDMNENSDGINENEANDGGNGDAIDEDVPSGGVNGDISANVYGINDGETSGGVNGDISEARIDSNSIGAEIAENTQSGAASQRQDSEEDDNNRLANDIYTMAFEDERWSTDWF